MYQRQILHHKSHINFCVIAQLGKKQLFNLQRFNFRTVLKPQTGLVLLDGTLQHKSART